MKQFLFAIVIIFLAVVTASAQDPKFKFGVFASASEIKKLFPDTNSDPSSELSDFHPNIVAEGLATVGKAGSFRFSTGVMFKNNFETEVRTYHGLGRLSYRAGKFEPFAQFSAGIDHDSIRSKETFSREILFGADINFKRFYFRPLGVGFKRTGEFLTPAERTFQSGFGINIP